MTHNETPVKTLSTRRRMMRKPLIQIFTVGICDIKNAADRPLFIFFSFNAIHLKFCNNIELTIPKKRMFFVFQILAFLRENDVTKFPPNFVFSIMGYLMMVSERSHHRDVKSEKNLKYAYPLKRYSVFKLNFPPFCAIFSNKMAEN